MIHEYTICMSIWMGICVSVTYKMIMHENSSMLEHMSCNMSIYVYADIDMAKDNYTCSMYRDCIY